ncbi:zinc finger MYM-type protein 1-like [Athalia rosae]|uniref:zinc finger MYM-type protein 1-like n=1 Tax=Athalia rosae TaxID=37344 RepID=UPI002033B719|nr:zinc finger MYM-type protein 1-like [Athalia rosae]
MERKKKSGWEYKKMLLAKEAALKKKIKSCSIPDTIAISPLMKNPDLTCAKPLDMQPDISMDIEDPKSSNANSEPVAKRIKLGSSISGSADCVPGDVGAIHDVIFSDPSKWPSITDRKIRQLIVEKGPVHFEDFDFPVENVGMMKKAKWYSIILDCTPDKSRIEQMSIIIRFVSYDEKAQKFEIREHFLGFLPITDTTGKGLTQVILDELQNLGIAFSDMRGQGYDNGANMKSKHSGVQNRILQRNPRAFFVPCSAHTLNLVVGDAAAATAVSDTRWESRVDAVKPVRYQLGEIYDALVEISLDEKNNNALKYETKCLAQSIANFKFICSVIIWFDILNKVNVASQLLQSPALNIVECCSISNKIIDFLKQYGSEESFSRILHEARDLASKVEIEPVFPLENTVRVRVVSIGERFQQLQAHSNDFKFLYDIHALKSSMKEEIMKSCKDLQITLTDGDHMDIDGIDLCDELINLALILPANQSLIEVLNYLVKNDLLSIVPNVVIALRILLSLPVSVASGERSFSKLNIIENYLRSTMSQERFVGLATISIEGELCDLIDYQELIADFAKVKARKISFE